MKEKLDKDINIKIISNKLVELDLPEDSDLKN